MVLLPKKWLSTKYNQKTVGMKYDSLKLFRQVLNEGFKINQVIQINFSRMIC